MSVYSNRKSEAPRHAFRYMEAVLDLLGRRDPVAILASQVKWLRAATAGMDDRALRTREAPGKWSVLEVLRHLADSELVYRYRLRRIVAEPGCRIVGYDQDAWCERLRYNDDDPKLAMRELELLRESNLRWLRTLSPEEFALSGQHEERGEESVLHILRLLAGHDLLHRAQIERIKASLVSV